jgi:cell division protein FtsN
MEVSDQAMAAEKQTSAASRRRAQLSGWVLSRFQVTLAVCGIVVGFLVCFGLGFLSGVWFQTQEQMVSRDDAIALADGQLDREQTTESTGREMTFYSALTSPDHTPESTLPPRDAPAAELPGQRPAASPGAPPSLQSGVPQAAKPVEAVPDTAEQLHAIPLTTDALPRSSASESPVETPTPPGRQPEALSAVAPEALFYSVQVGSFRNVEQASRLQNQLIKKGYQARIGLSIVEGHGAWYRVRVGRYADRGAADKSARRLQENENIDVLVMRESS